MKVAMRLVLFGALIECVGTSVAGGQNVELVPATPAPLAVTPTPIGIAVNDSDTTAVTHRRPRAIEYSDWYARRLLIHRVGSYTMLPLFGAEYYLGQQLLNGDGTDSQKSMHGLVAGGLGALFTINTVTGLWNLYDSRQDPTGRTKKVVHSALMIAADAGFAWAGAIGGGARENSSTRSLHKNIAIGSMGLSTVGAAMMWFWRD